MNRVKGKNIAGLRCLAYAVNIEEEPPCTKPENG